MMKKMFSLFFCLNYDLKDNDENVLFYLRLIEGLKQLLQFFVLAGKLHETFFSLLNLCSSVKLFC